MIMLMLLFLISFVDINCSVGSLVDNISPVDDDCSVVFCNFVDGETISSVYFVISSVDVNCSFVIDSFVDMLVVSVTYVADPSSIDV